MYLGELEKAEYYFDKARAFGESHHLPKGQMDRMESLITKVKTHYQSEWQKGQVLGAVRLPVGPSLGPEGCALCHTGAYVPDYYYKR